MTIELIAGGVVLLGILIIIVVCCCKKKQTLKDYDDYEDDEDLILNHLKDFAVLNLNDVNNAFGTSDLNGSSYMALEFDAFYKEEKPFKGNSLWFYFMNVFDRSLYHLQSSLMQML